MTLQVLRTLTYTDLIPVPINLIYHCLLCCPVMQLRTDEPPLQISEATRKKAEAAKSYIENMYTMQHQNIQERMERCVEHLTMLKYLIKSKLSDIAHRLCLKGMPRCKG